MWPKARSLPSIAWLTKQQCANGLWTSYRAGHHGGLPGGRPEHLRRPGHQQHRHGRPGSRGVRPAARGSSGARDASSAIQSRDGGLPVPRRAGPVLRPELDRAVDPGAARRAGPARAGDLGQGGATPYAALARYQLGCADPAADRGRSSTRATARPNIFATVQAVPALAKADPAARPRRSPSTAVPRHAVPRHRRPRRGHAVTTATAPAKALAGTAGPAPPRPA